MVTETQARQADPVVAKIDALNVLIGQINRGSAEGGWTAVTCTMLDKEGNPVAMAIETLPGANVLNDLFQLAQAALSQAEADLAAI